MPRVEFPNIILYCSSASEVASKFFDSNFLLIINIVVTVLKIILFSLNSSFKLPSKFLLIYGEI